MPSEILAEIRNELVLELHSMDSAGCSSQEIVERFTTKKERLVKSASPALIQTALIKILNEARGRRAPISAVVDQPDFFLSTYNGLRVFSIPMAGQAEHTNIKLNDMTCDQLRAWCIKRRRLRKLRDREDAQLKEAERILAEVKDFRVSSETTIKEALEAAEATRISKKKEAYVEHVLVGNVSTQRTVVPSW